MSKSPELAPPGTPTILPDIQFGRGGRHVIREYRIAGELTDLYLLYPFECFSPTYMQGAEGVAVRAGAPLHFSPGAAIIVIDELQVHDLLGCSIALV